MKTHFFVYSHKFSLFFFVHFDILYFKYGKMQTSSLLSAFSGNVECFAQTRTQGAPKRGQLVVSAAEIKRER